MDLEVCFFFMTQDHWVKNLILLKVLQIGGYVVRYLMLKAFALLKNESSTLYIAVVFGFNVK